MTDQSTEYVPDVPLSAEEERAARNGTHAKNAEAPKLPVFECSTCGDSGKVRLLFQTTAGLHPGKAEIACPDCKAGKVSIGSVGEKIADLEGAIRLLKRAVLVALIVAAIAFFWDSVPRPSNPFAEAVKEATEA